MKVSKKSWHYQLFEFYTDNHTYNLNLCSYVRGMFKSFFFAILVILFAVLVALLALEPLAVGIMTLITGHFIPTFFLDSGGMLLWFSFISYTILGCICLVEYTRNRWSDYRYRVREKKEEQEPEAPSRFVTLLREYYKAFKDKTCPLVEAE